MNQFELQQKNRFASGTEVKLTKTYRHTQQKGWSTVPLKTFRKYPMKVLNVHDNVPEAIRVEFISPSGEIWRSHVHYKDLIIISEIETIKQAKEPVLFDTTDLVIE